jgi:hypothetical protein
MKPNYSSHILVREWAASSLVYKLLVASVVLSLLFASLPVHPALAAPSGTNNYAQEWSDKLTKLRNNGIFYERVRVYPADFEDPDELALAHQYLNEYGVALRAAQRVAINHSGFNQKGKVVNDELANQSLKDLHENLRLMSVAKEKLNRLDGDYRLLPPGAVTTAASQ